MQAPIEPQDAKPRAVIERGVLKRPAPGDFDELHVDLDTFARLVFFEQLHLAGHPFRGTPQPRQPQIAEDPLDRAHCHAHLVHPAQPQLRARRPISQISTRLADELDDPRSDAPASAAWITRHQPLHSVLSPPRPPAPNRPDANAEAAPGRRRAIQPCEVQHHQPLSDPQPILHAHLHIAQFDHLTLPRAARLPIKAGAVNLD